MKKVNCPTILWSMGPLQTVESRLKRKGCSIPNSRKRSYGYGLHYLPDANSFWLFFEYLHKTPDLKQPCVKVWLCHLNKVLCYEFFFGLDFLKHLTDGSAHTQNSSVLLYIYTQKKLSLKASCHELYLGVDPSPNLFRLVLPVLGFAVLKPSASFSALFSSGTARFPASTRWSTSLGGSSLQVLLKQWAWCWGMVGS